MPRPPTRTRPWRWTACLTAAVAASSLTLVPDPTPQVVQAEAFAVRAVDVSGRRHPIATFDGRGWLVDRPASLVGPPAPDPPAIVGLETSEGVPVTTVRVYAATGAAWRWAQRAAEELALATSPIGERRTTEVSMYVPAGIGSDAVYVDLSIRTPEPRWQGAVVGTWVMPVKDEAPMTLGSRVSAFKSYAEFIRIPRRHPLGIAVAGRGGEQTWVMYDRSPAGDGFELAGVSRRGLRELPRIPRGPS